MDDGCFLVDMRPRTVILTSVALSVLASAITTALLRGSEPPPRTAGPVQTRQPGPETGIPPPAPPDAALEERVRRIEARLNAGSDAPPTRSNKEAVDALLAITQGERQVAIADSFRELVSMGDDIVPEIVALLKSGRDLDWGGGFSFSGNMVRGYPRLRTLLIDVLRQIGTPAALTGLLDGLHGTEDPTDFRDLYLLFRTTTDHIMVEGISAMTPFAVHRLKDADEKQAYLLSRGVTDWIQQHEVPNKIDLVEELARLGAGGNRLDRASFPLLVALSPERAFALTQEIREKQGDTGLRTMIGGLTTAQDTPRAQIVRYSEMLLAAGLDERQRFSLYTSLPSGACAGIKDPAARDADTRKLLEFLRGRLSEETTEYVRVTLTRGIGSLESSLGG